MMVSDKVGFKVKIHIMDCKIRYEFEHSDACFLTKYHVKHNAHIENYRN